MPAQTAITIGNFDGVHIGHAALVRRARELAGPGGRVVVLAFDPHPQTILRPASAPARIMPFERRRDLLRSLGADEVERLEPSRELLSLTPEEFVARKVSLYSPSAIVEGTDFRFGHRRAGDVGTLAVLGERYAFSAVVVPPVDVVLNDHQIVTASSTITRWLLARGRVADAARVLGRPHEIAGKVVSGDRRGRTIGFPTANLSTDDLRPADGVYAALATLPDSTELPAAVNIGVRPTFSGTEHRLEAHLLAPVATPSPSSTPSWSPLPGLPEYAWPLRLRMISWIRDQVRFDSPASLVRQLARDCERVRERVRFFRESACVPALPQTTSAGAPA